MKITDVEVIMVSVPDVRPDASDGSQDTAIVKVTTDEGIVGIGEADTSPWVAKAIIEAKTSHPICRGLREMIIGENPFESAKIWEKMYFGTLHYGRRGAAIHAMSGIDLALWDIKGKALGKPVHELLGASYRTKIRAYASVLFGATPAETGDIARGLVDQGFTAVKFGWAPLGQDEENDVALVRAIREAVGPDVDVMIDAGLVYDTKTAIRRARRFEEFNIFWLEEPLVPDDLDGYAKLAAAVDVRIAAGEQETSRFSYLDLMDRGQIDIVQVDVTRCGGLTEAMRIAQLAQDRHRPVVNHSYTSGINLASSLHFTAALPNAFIFEYCMSGTAIREAVTRESFPVVDGMVAIPQEPGLGVTLNDEGIARCRFE